MAADKQILFRKSVQLLDIYLDKKDSTYVLDILVDIESEFNHHIGNKVKIELRKTIEYLRDDLVSFGLELPDEFIKEINRVLEKIEREL